jgi:hypothetical protein
LATDFPACNHPFGTALVIPEPFGFVRRDVAATSAGKYSSDDNGSNCDTFAPASVFDSNTLTRL